MDRLLESIFQLVVDQHSSKIRGLAKKSRTLDVADAGKLAGYFSTQAANDALAEVLEQWLRVGCSGDELAGLLQGASHGYLTERSREAVELVWSGPDTHHVPVRRSEQVYLELIESARDSLFIGSYVWVNIPKIEMAIREAIARGVDVRMLLESTDKGADTFFKDTIARVTKELPGATIYVWPQENRDLGAGGYPSMHAKCAVADGKRAFLTSANLTSAAMDKNIETGVLADGGNVPRMLSRQFLNMITQGDIQTYAQVMHVPAAAEAQPSVIDIKDLEPQRNYGETLLVKFHNEKLDVEETRAFRLVSQDDELPDKGKVVIIPSDEWLVGKIHWQKQQNTGSAREFYLVSVRGFGDTKSIEVEASDWSSFKPFAVEVDQID